MKYRPLRLLFPLLLPAPLLAAKPRGLHEARAAEAAAVRYSAARHEAAARAQAASQAAAAKAAVLAQQQVVAAAALRQVEDQTAAVAARYAALQGQAQGAAAALQADAAALSKLLPVMQRLAAEPAASLLAVPETPADAVRGVIVLQGVAAEIERRAAAIREQTALVAALTAQAKAQQDALAHAATTQQAAEAGLSSQIAAAKTAEMADAQTALDRTAAALAADRKLHGLHDIVARLLATPAPRPPPLLVSPASAAASAAGAPVAGSVVQAFGAATLAGPADGVSYRAAPGARVVSLCAGPVKYADKFQGYGLVVITDCGHGDYAVLSGLAHLDVSAGEMLARRQPVGEMAAFDPAAPARQPVLYVELRHDGTPVDPAAWLGGNGSG